MVELVKGLLATLFISSAIMAMENKQWITLGFVKGHIRSGNMKGFLLAQIHLGTLTDANVMTFTFLALKQEYENMAHNDNSWNAILFNSQRKEIEIIPMKHKHNNKKLIEKEKQT